MVEMRAISFVASFAGAQGAIFMPAIFSDGMVLQTNNAYGQRPFIYGQADAGEMIQVNRTDKYNAVDQYTATTDSNGDWIVTLNPESTSDNFTFSVGGSSDGYASVITILDATYGDVFLCSGQSNMVFSVKADFEGPAIAAQSYPTIRLFSIVQGGAEDPQRDLIPVNKSDPHSSVCWWTQDDKPWNDTSGQACNVWQSATPGITDEFSAICFFTAMNIAKQFPTRNIGLIYGAYCGTPMQAWSPPEALAQCNSTSSSSSSKHTVSKDLVAPVIASTGVNPNDPMVLWNAMIAPISRYSIRAVLWYQGESDSGDAAPVFACKFNAMIEAWRRRWRIGDFAFLFVQLAPQDAPKWPQYYMLDARLGQAMALPLPGTNTTDVTGMAPAYDSGDMGSPYQPAHVHPRNKTGIGMRLAAALLHTQYAWQWPAGGANLSASTIMWRGPVPVTVTSVASALSSPRTSLRAVTDTAAQDPSIPVYSLQLSTLDGHGIRLLDTADCWECCAAANDTFQVCDYEGFDWRNVSVSLSTTDNETLILTPMSAPSSRGYAQIRYAANLWPQCAVYAATNLYPMDPFILNISTGTIKIVDVAPAQPPSHVRVGSAIPAASLGSHTWKTWKGRAVPSISAVAAALTPPMGFNSWNGYHCNVDEHIVRRVADILVSSGLSALGYQYVNIDDCWQVDRRPNGTIVEDPVRFPSGMKAMADYVHAAGLLFGVYTAQHALTCQQRPGSYQHETIDAATYCSWGIDYLKTDGCGGAAWPALNTSWILFRQGIDACSSGGGRDIVLSVESCTSANKDDCQAWVGALANLWRTTPDIQSTWASILSNLDNNNLLAHIAGPGHWNDADMLQVGSAGLSDSEQRAHFAAWAVIASPLLIGTDVVSGMDTATLEILMAPEVIAVSQDPLGVQGVRVSVADPNGVECWARPLADGSVAALLLNRGESSAIVTCTWADLGLDNPSRSAAVRDLWARQDLGPFTAQYDTQVQPHAAMLVKVKQ